MLDVFRCQNFPALYGSHSISMCGDLPDFSNLRHRSVMEPLFHFALALLNAGVPWLGAVIVVAIALAIVGPVELSLSIRDRSGKRGR